MDNTREILFNAIEEEYKEIKSSASYKTLLEELDKEIYAVLDMLYTKNYDLISFQNNIEKLKEIGDKVHIHLRYTNRKKQKVESYLE